METEVKRTIILALLFTSGTAILATGCAVTAPIQPAANSESAFAGAVYKGQSVTIKAAQPGNEAYRVFIQGSTGFVSIQSVRDDAERRANDFCERRGGVADSLSETTAVPPYILGNFPRIEIVFQCIAKPVVLGPASIDDPKYNKLVDLKKLLDSGVITQQEFEAEKAKILSQP